MRNAWNGATTWNVTEGQEFIENSQLPFERGTNGNQWILSWILCSRLGTGYNKLNLKEPKTSVKWSQLRSGIALSHASPHFYRCSGSVPLKFRCCRTESSLVRRNCKYADCASFWSWLRETAVVCLVLAVRLSSLLSTVHTEPLDLKNFSQKVEHSRVREMFVSPTFIYLVSLRTYTFRPNFGCFRARTNDNAKARVRGTFYRVHSWNNSQVS